MTLLFVQAVPAGEIERVDARQAAIGRVADKHLHGRHRRGVSRLS